MLMPQASLGSTRRVIPSTVHVPVSHSRLLLPLLPPARGRRSSASPIAIQPLTLVSAIQDTIAGEDHNAIAYEHNLSYLLLFLYAPKVLSIQQLCDETESVQVVELRKCRRQC